MSSSFFGHPAQEFLGDVTMFCKRYLCYTKDINKRS